MIFYITSYYHQLEKLTISLSQKSPSLGKQRGMTSSLTKPIPSVKYWVLLLTHRCEICRCFMKIYEKQRRTIPRRKHSRPRKHFRMSENDGVKLDCHKGNLSCVSVRFFQHVGIPRGGNKT